MKHIKIFFAVIMATLLVACSQVPLTGRRQISLVSDAELQAAADQAYAQFLAENRSRIVTNTSEGQRVVRIGNQIASAINRYMQENGYGDQYNYRYEFNLVSSNDINAWAMPGGKVAVFTGLLPIAQNDAGLATVMAHEIAHAIARHTAERYSQVAAAQIGGGILGAATGGASQGTQAVIGQLYGLGGQLALLRYNRKQETEADRLGLIFMAMAGYNPDEALNFWMRMSSAKQGGAPPEFLSTHPSDDTRMAEIQRRLPEARTYYARSR